MPEKLARRSRQLDSSERKVWIEMLEPYGVAAYVSCGVDAGAWRDCDLGSIHALNLRQVVVGVDIYFIMQHMKMMSWAAFAVAVSRGRTRSKIKEKSKDENKTCDNACQSIDLLHLVWLQTGV